MIVLTGSLSRQSRHDFRWNILHALYNEVSNMLEGSVGFRLWRVLFGKFLHPRLKRKALSGGPRFERSSGLYTSRDSSCRSSVVLT